VLFITLFVDRFQKGEKMKPSEVKAIIAEVDENRDGKLDYNEVMSL
jgi:Ca2+-binding EF-hand superfamily protein